MHLDGDDQKGSDLSSKNFNISMIKDSKRNQSNESKAGNHRESNMERNTHRSKDSPVMAGLSKNASKERKDEEISPFEGNTPLGKVGNLNTEHSEPGNKSPLSNSRTIIGDCKIKKSTGPSPNMSASNISQKIEGPSEKHQLQFMQAKTNFRDKITIKSKKIKS